MYIYIYTHICSEAKIHRQRQKQTLSELLRYFEKSQKQYSKDTLQGTPCLNCLLLNGPKASTYHQN